MNLPCSDICESQVMIQLNITHLQESILNTNQVFQTYPETKMEPTYPPYAVESSSFMDDEIYACNSELGDHGSDISFWNAILGNDFTEKLSVREQYWVLVWIWTMLRMRDICKTSVRVIVLRVPMGISDLAIDILAQLS